jgi:Ca-activated chloride channel homolog
MRLRQIRGMSLTWRHGIAARSALRSCWRPARGLRSAGGHMIRFLQPEWFWLLALLPLVMLWRGRRGPVAAVEYSDVGLARCRRRTRAAGSAAGYGCCRSRGRAHDRRAGAAAAHHSRTEVTANGIDIVLGLDVSGSMQALDFWSTITASTASRSSSPWSRNSSRSARRPHRPDRVRRCALPGESAHARSRLAAAESRARQRRRGDDGTAIGSAIARASITCARRRRNPRSSFCSPTA